MIPKGWKEGHISDVITGLESGVSVNGEDRLRAPSEKGVLKVSAVSYGIFDENAQKVISKKEELVRAKTNPKAGQIIISRSNTEKFVGASVYIEKNYDYLFLPDKLWQTVPKSGINTKWLSYVLASTKSRYTLSKLATGTSGSMKNITKGELLGLKILIPPSIEQFKIAETLSTWDKAIETVEKLIENSRAQKKALMQQLLTGKKRFAGFEGEWEEMKLRGLTATITKGTTPSSNGFDFQSSGINFIKVESILSNGIFNKSKFAFIDDECHQSLKRSQLKNNDILFSIAGALGRTAIVNEAILPANTNQALAIIRFISIAVDITYAYYQLNSQSIIRAIRVQTAQAAQPNLSLKDVGDFKLKLPCLTEQQKIVSVLSNADKEIELLEQQRSDLKQEKKALMQQLLTGKCRVTVATTSETLC